MIIKKKIEIKSRELFFIILTIILLLFVVLFFLHSSFSVNYFLFLKSQDGKNIQKYALLLAKTQPTFFVNELDKNSDSIDNKHLLLAIDGLRENSIKDTVWLPIVVAV